jgi:3-deoxy-7-phosphoheptulonate synthase
MTDQRVENLNINSYTRLITPEELKRRLPISERATASVITGRGVIKDILDHRDPRLFIVVGPCSIHDPAAAIEYGRRLKALAGLVEDTLYLVMRVYFEKPRSTIG